MLGWPTLGFTGVKIDGDNVVVAPEGLVADAESGLFDAVVGEAVPVDVVVGE
jgi:hypothetical protein